jgi:hypothetical protein
MYQDTNTKPRSVSLTSRTQPDGQVPSENAHQPRVFIYLNIEVRMTRLTEMYMGKLLGAWATVTGGS